MPRMLSGSMSSLLLSVAGGALMGGRSRRAPRGAMSVVGALVLIGIAAHRPVADALHRASVRRRSATLRLSFVVPHPVGMVFRFCSDFGNFPRFIGALRAVYDYGDGRSHWIGWTPTGGMLEWDTVTTKFVTNKVIAWESTARSPVRTSGTLRFIPSPEGGTCIKVALDYTVASRNLVEAVAALAVPSRVKELEANIRRLPGQLDLITSATQPTIPSS